MTLTVSGTLKVDATIEIKAHTQKYEYVTLAKYIPLFAADGTATGNDVVGLLQQTIQFYDTAAAIVADQTDEDLAAIWLLATGENVPDVRDRLLELGGLVRSLRDVLAANANLILVDSFNADGGLNYTALTAGQRDAIKNLLDPIAAFIV